jgi:DNA-binding transcriptional LysR family regulator
MTGRFISTFPSATLSFFPRRWELKLLPVKQSLNHWPVGVFALKNRTNSPLAQRFIDCCSELAKGRDGSRQVR